MFREKRSILQISMLTCDLTLTVLSFFIAYWLRISIPLPWFKEGGVYPLLVTMKALLLLLPLWWALYLQLGRYQPVTIMGRYTLPLLPAYRANVLGMLVAITVAYFLRIVSVSRALVLLFFVVNCLLLTLWRLVLLLFSASLYFPERDRRHVLVVGEERRGRFVKRLEQLRDEWGITVVDAIERQAVERLEQLLSTTVVDDVVFVLGKGKLQDIEPQIAICEQRGVAIHIMTDWFRDSTSKVRMEDFFGVPMISVDTGHRKVWETLVKRAIDLTVAGLGLVVLSPLLAAIALVIKLASPGPVLFSQARCGLNGRMFRLYKFRSMVPGAEQLQESLQHRNEMTGPVFKIKNDPRLTGIGKFLRRTSLDELPQLWNVVKGELSLVGPRPLPEHEVQQLTLWQRRRISVLPGITCLWQISGRNEVSFEDWMRLDMQYIDTWSLWVDLKILLLTVPAVLLQRGAR